MAESSDLTAVQKKSGLTAVQKKNCGGRNHCAFLRVVPPPRKTGFNPFGSGKSKKWAEDEVKRVVQSLGAKVRCIFFQKKKIRDGVFVCTGVLIWFEKGMHPKAVSKMLKNKPVRITRKIRVREDHDEEKFGAPIEEWEWRFVPAMSAPLTKEEQQTRRRKKIEELVLSSDSESDEEDDGF